MGGAGDGSANRPPWMVMSTTPPLNNLKDLSSPKYFATNLNMQLYWQLSPTHCSVSFLCMFSLSIFYRNSIKVNKANEIGNLNKAIKGIRSNFIKIKRGEGRRVGAAILKWWGTWASPLPPLKEYYASRLDH